MNLPIITFGEDEQGEVYLTTQLGGGIIYKFATAKWSRAELYKQTGLETAWFSGLFLCSCENMCNIDVWNVEFGSGC